jgi:hypothetical protein
MRQRKETPTLLVPSAEDSSSDGTTNLPVESSRENVYSGSRAMQLSVVVAMGVAFAVFSNSLRCEFSYDDTMAVQGNRDVTGQTAIWQLFENDFWGLPMSDRMSHKSFRPVTVLSFRLNALLSGGVTDPVPFHATNVAVHAAVSGLVVLLAAFLFADVPPDDAPAANGIALVPRRDPTAVVGPLLAGCIFALHPVHCDAVVSLVGRAELLCALFALASLLAHTQATAAIASRRSPRGADDRAVDRFGFGAARAVAWTGVCLASALLSLLSKEQGIAALPLCVAFDVFAGPLQIDPAAAIRVGRAAAPRRSSGRGKGLLYCRWLLLAGSAIALAAWRAQLGDSLGDASLGDSVGDSVAGAAGAAGAAEADGATASYSTAATAAGGALFYPIDNPAAFAPSAAGRRLTFALYHAHHLAKLANPLAPLSCDWSGDSLPVLRWPLVEGSSGSGTGADGVSGGSTAGAGGAGGADTAGNAAGIAAEAVRLLMAALVGDAGGGRTMRQRLSQAPSLTQGPPPPARAHEGTGDGAQEGTHTAAAETEEHRRQTEGYARVLLLAVAAISLAAFALGLLPFTSVPASSDASGSWHRRALGAAAALLVLPYLPAANILMPVGFAVAERVLYVTPPPPPPFTPSASPSTAPLCRSTALTVLCSVRSVRDMRAAIAWEGACSDV